MKLILLFFLLLYTCATPINEKPNVSEVKKLEIIESPITISEQKKEIDPLPQMTFTNSIGIEFVFIPSGEFIMGCSKGDRECNQDENPPHNIKITKSFYMGKYEVTQGQWEKVMRNNPSEYTKCGNNCPVENINWNDAKEFIEKLNSMGEKKYRLPSEAEWEYSARAGTATKFYWGNEIDGDYAWFLGNSDVGYAGGFENDFNRFKNRKLGTHPVGLKKPNAFGLFDMSGNVWEWVEDIYDKNSYKNISKNNNEGKKYIDRVMRGGSWYNGAGQLRSSSRFYNGPTIGGFNGGFRLAMD